MNPRMIKMERGKKDFIAPQFSLSVLKDFRKAMQRCQAIKISEIPGSGNPLSGRGWNRCG